MISPPDIGKALQSILPEQRIKSRLIDLVSYASDAGFYYLRPKAVVQPVNEKEIVDLFAFCVQHDITLTFRTGGTSLSGQAITDGILVDLSQYWNRHTIEENGFRVRVQPGITGARVNHYLKKHHRKIGPDPSSIDSAMIGGILSNNASGMCCGVLYNSYHTTRYIRFIFPDGKIFSTEHQAEYARFEKECPVIYDALAALKQEITRNAPLCEKITSKYKIKNTVGYSLNAFLDYTHPLDIIAHLLIGGEGTLGFISEAVLDTIPDYPCKATSLMYFTDIFAACSAIVPLSVLGAQAIELMDRASLRSIEHIPGVPERLRTLPETASALLVEFQGNSFEEVRGKITMLEPMASSFSLLENFSFTENPVDQAFLWKLRKGMFPAVGAVRKSGTTVILEDIAFPVDRLGNAILDLQALFSTFHYDNAIIFGHARDGNIHFVVTQSFREPSEVERYDAFMREVVNLVVKKYDGSLKAEHGTGRNMAPFVETEWGADAYSIMKKLKSVIDPLNILNPGVIINHNRHAHIQHLKELPTVEPEVDKCIECGFCEPVCPSRNLTMTPRRRIVARREMATLREAGKNSELQKLFEQYQYDGLDTCAVDGLCASACPVDINTGNLVKRLRAENHNALANRMAMFVARHFKSTAAVVWMALNLGSGVNRLFGRNAMKKLTSGAGKVFPAFPLWSNQLKANAVRKRKHINNMQATDTVSVVYFPACISRVMGGSADGKKNLLDTFFSVASKSKIRLILPEGLGSYCCGQIFSSKGFNNAYAYTSNKTVAYLWQVSEEGKIPVVLDASSCTFTLQHCRPVLDAENVKRFDRLKIIDSIDFLYDFVLPRVTRRKNRENVVLHPVCSLKKMNLENKFYTIAKQFATQVTVPVNAGCCGMAGDRGFVFPELTASATAPEAREVMMDDYEGYYSSAKTCEMALSDAVKKNYESILYLVDECI